MTGEPPVGAGANGAAVRDGVVALLPHLRAFARSLVGGDRPHLADDLVQDTVVLALRGWRQFAPGTDLKAWLFRILHNRCRSVLRRKHVASEVHVEDLEHRATAPATQEGALEAAAFKRAFARLSRPHREVLLLAGVHGMAYERIAEVCGCELGTVKSRANRARALLRAMLAGDGEPSSAERAAGEPWAKPRPAPPPASHRARPGRAAVLATPGPGAIVAAKAPAASTPIHQPAPALPACPGSWLVDAERRLTEAESHVTRHRRIVEWLARAGLGGAGAEALLRLAERRLALVESHRERLLLDGGAARGRSTRSAAAGQEHTA
jgi:RNA polymerase sigma-70 factor, ECF subfamily